MRQSNYDKFPSTVIEGTIFKGGMKYVIFFPIA